MFTDDPVVIRATLKSHYGGLDREAQNRRPRRAAGRAGLSRRSRFLLRAARLLISLGLSVYRRYQGMGWEIEPATYRVAEENSRL